MRTATSNLFIAGSHKGRKESPAKHERDSAQESKLCFSADSYLVYGIRRDSPSTLTVMAGLVPAIHAFRFAAIKDMGARDGRGHDDGVAPRLGFESAQVFGSGNLFHDRFYYQVYRLALRVICGSNKVYTSVRH